MKRPDVKYLIVSGIIMLAGFLILVDTAVEEKPGWELYAIGGAILTLGALIALLGERLKGISLKKIALGPASIEIGEDQYYQATTQLAHEVKKNELDRAIRTERESYAETKHLPGRSAPQYSALQLAKINKLLVRPSAYPMTPMYLLDSDYRILDWNEAFSLAFDRTMEGRQGQSVLEWAYHLDNFQDVLDHGEAVYADPARLPTIDLEDIVYNSLRYGRIEAVKRAYQIPDDNGQTFAWLITLDLTFSNPKEKSRYRYELLRLMGLDQLWSEYAISYDRVLANTRVYRDLIDTLIGKIEPLHEIADDARVLDLGAGTGNIALRLMSGESRRIVFALDNNRVMLEFLRDKCRELLRDDDQSPGIIAIKQDVTSLFGLADNYFDCVIANNVFYALPDPEASLEAIFRVLKPGGELRTSGPTDVTDLDPLFKRIRHDLEAAGKFREFRADYERVEQINKLRLKTMLHKWSTGAFCELLEQAGFVVHHASEDVYAGQSMMVIAAKPHEETTGTHFDFGSHTTGA